MDDKDERKELLHKFVRQLITAGTPALNALDMLDLGIREDQEIGFALEALDQAMATPMEIRRYVEACAETA
jgi:hypothetical protein